MIYVYYILSVMSDIYIQPIFDQSAPGVWDDFLRIRNATMTADYNMPLTDSDIIVAHQDYEQNWQSYSGNFAFGAYDADHNMIGCVHGVVHKNVAHLQQLHVDPQYQGQHIGRRLLTMAQDAASIMSARYIELISMSKARLFYESMGYKGLSWTDYQKNLSYPRCVVTPVFHCNPVLARACGLDKEVVKQVNKSCLPMFVSYDHQSKVNGYVILDANGARLIDVRDNNPRQLVRHALERRVNSYLSHIQSLQR